MRGHEAAHEHGGSRWLAWAILGAAFLTLLVVLASPSQAQAQVTPVCPTNGPGPAPPHDTCRPLCETPASVLTVNQTGLGSGTFTTTAVNPYSTTSGNYQTKGDPDCAVRQASTDVWDVKKNCGFHCVHWHTQIPTYGVPVPATALVTATPDVVDPDYFTGWSSNCAPSANKAVHRNVCSIAHECCEDDRGDVRARRRLDPAARTGAIGLGGPRLRPDAQLDGDRRTRPGRADSRSTATAAAALFSTAASARRPGR